MSRNAPMKDWNLDCKVYVGDLGHGCAKQELEERFSKYGNLVNVWIARKPPGFAFVEFEDHRDADDAVRALDGTRINGKKVKVEMSSGKSRWGHSGPPRRGDSTTMAEVVAVAVVAWEDPEVADADPDQGLIHPEGDPVAEASQTHQDVAGGVGAGAKEMRKWNSLTKDCQGQVPSKLIFMKYVHIGFIIINYIMDLLLYLEKMMGRGEFIIIINFNVVII